MANLALFQSLQSAATLYLRPASTGQQSFTPDPSTAPVGQPIPSPPPTSPYVAELLLPPACHTPAVRCPSSALSTPQASGEAAFLDDKPPPARTLFGAFVATKVNVYLDTIDATAALAMPGVRHILTAADIPQHVAGYCPSAVLGGITPDPEPLFLAPTQLVMFYGQAIGMILADTQIEANRAAKVCVCVGGVGCVSVAGELTHLLPPFFRPSPPRTRIQPLLIPLILSLDEAIAAGSEFTIGVSPVTLGKDITAALAECDVVQEGEVEVGASTTSTWRL